MWCHWPQIHQLSSEANVSAVTRYRSIVSFTNYDNKGPNKNFFLALTSNAVKFLFSVCFCCFPCLNSFHVCLFSSSYLNWSTGWRSVVFMHARSIPHFNTFLQKWQISMQRLKIKSTQVFVHELKSNLKSPWWRWAPSKVLIIIFYRLSRDLTNEEHINVT